MNVSKRGQTVTEVGQNQAKISAATKDVFIHSDQLAAVLSILRAFLRVSFATSSLGSADISSLKSAKHNDFLKSHVN